LFSSAAHDWSCLCMNSFPVPSASLLKRNSLS